MTATLDLPHAPRRPQPHAPLVEVVVPVYNERFSDAQCGFKAIRADAARRLLPAVEDDAWFFDTELLVLAQRADMRIHEVAVDWVDDPDSRVDIVSTALADLRGVARLVAVSPVARFLAIGVLSTIAYALLYLLLHGPLGADGGNAVALGLTAVANTQANRRFTFRIRGRAGPLRQHGAGALVYLITLGLTEAALAVLAAVGRHPARLVEVAVLVVASAVATATRYVVAQGVGVRAGAAAAGAGRRDRGLNRRPTSATIALVPDNAGGLIYGIIVVATLLAAESARSETYAETIGGVAIALVTYWLLIAYSHYVGTRLERNEPFRYGDVARAAVHELPVLYGAAIPLVVLALCWIAGASLSTAINVAIGSEAAAVIAIEVIIGVRADLTGPDLVRQTAVGATLGLLVIALRLILH